jgi:anti-sigma regulatory factor (Ser/Thr protein kinase)
MQITNTRRDMNHETHLGEPRRPRTGSNPRASVLGSLTIEGHPSQVSAARTFVSRTLTASHLKVDSDAATLLTSEIVTNAILHTKSGADGSVTIVVISVPHGVLVEVIDEGSAGVPIVKGDLYAAEGHGMFLVQQLAAQWGYLRDPAGTTVWFHLPTPDGPGLSEDEPGPAAEQLSPREADRRRQPDTYDTMTPRESHPRLSVAAAAC